MTEWSVYLQPAFILQQRKYQETSLIIDLLTRDFGRIALLAKGVRKSKSKTAGLLQPFVPLAISYFGKSDLKILGTVEVMYPFKEIKGLSLYCGFYINELVSRFLHKYDPHPEVFADYSECLSGLADSSKIEVALRIFELNLIENIGYGLNLAHDFLNEKPVDPLKKYHFNIESGPIAAVDGVFSGATLLALESRELTDPQALIEAKMLMRKVIDVHLQGNPLKSRAVISQIIKTYSESRK
jgi:DNA repair protein RecO (recombination protein O)